MVQAGLETLYQKQSEEKGDGVMTQAEACLPSKPKPLSSNSSIIKKNNPLYFESQTYFSPPFHHGVSTTFTAIFFTN
jgi:hypothetical protein